MALAARRSAESRPIPAPRVLHRPPYPRGTGVGVRRRRPFIFSPCSSATFWQRTKQKTLVI